MSTLKSILLVEDDDISFFVTKNILSKSKITKTIYRVRNGEEGIDLLKMLNKEKEELPELILLDINMPVMNGFEFLETLKTLPCFNKNKTVISALTSSEDNEDKKKLKEYGVLYMTKPIKSNTLKALERYLTMKSSVSKKFNPPVKTEQE